MPSMAEQATTHTKSMMLREQHDLRSQVVRVESGARKRRSVWSPRWTVERVVDFQKYNL